MVYRHSLPHPASGGIVSLKFFNTLSRSLEEFKEIHPGEIGLYTCGPTVYDYNHIGNFRAYVFEDLAKRYLIHRGFRVHHVMNITDIDDKTIRKANELKVSLNEATDIYIQAFFADMETLNIRKADIYPRATDHIPEMVALIETLLEKGYAYRKEGSIYFSIAKFPRYGRLSWIEADHLKSGLRVDVDEYGKENVQDFALWKSRKEGEPFWSTAIGEGRPGWHIECSAMSMKYLGPSFDIHMGGVDNIFPHHENEIAQSECATGVTFVNYWLHCQHLVVNNQKMSKSLGNQYTLRDLAERGHDPLAIRYLLAASHYRKPLNFTFENLRMAAEALARINDFVFDLQRPRPAKGEAASTIRQLIAENHAAFCQNMDDDLNVSGALGIFFDFISGVNRLRETLGQEDVDRVRAYVRGIDSVLGVLRPERRENLEEEILAKIHLREEARRRKDFVLADRIRQELKEGGIQLLDTPEGVRWKVEREGATST